MRAKKILHTKEVKGDEIVEIKVWQVPKTEDMPHGVKYSLVYIKDGRRLIGYDNAERKGDHRHYSDKSESYAFKSIWNVLRDFKNDIKKLRGGDWDED